MKWEVTRHHFPVCKNTVWIWMKAAAGTSFAYVLVIVLVIVATLCLALFIEFVVKAYRI
jgi:tetrahydromethanopterin S-methyltransferase subunit B